MRFFYFICRYLQSILLLFLNFFLIPKLIYILFKRKNIFLVGNGAIGHYPANMFLAKKIYGNNTIYVHKSNTQFANKFLFDKCIEEFNFNQNYETVYKMNLALKTISFNYYQPNFSQNKYILSNNI